MRIITQPVNQENAESLRSMGFDPIGAVHHHVQHGRGRYMDEGDYALLELRDGSVFAFVYVDVGLGMPLATPVDA